MRAARSVGSPRASSKPLVCRLCVPPSTAASACTVTRTMLFSGCWAVSVEPPVCVWKRSSFDDSFLAPKRSVMMRYHMRRAARYFATSSKTLLWAFQKKERRGANSSTSRPGVDRGLHVGDAVGERERDLLHGRRAGLTDVVAGDRDRVPLRDALAAVGEDVGDEPHRRTRRVDVRAAGDVLLQQVVLDRAVDRRRRHALLLGDELVEQQQDGRRRVDRHRRRHLVERQVAQQQAHVLERVDGHADLADLALGARVVRVVAHLRREGRRRTTGRSDPPGSRNLKRSLVASALPKPAYCRIVHSRPRYIDG